MMNTWYIHPRSHNDEEDEEFVSNQDKQVSVEKSKDFSNGGGELSSFSTPHQKDDSSSVSNMRLVAQETKTLQKIRIALFCFIFAVAVFATFGVYYFSRSNETQSYQADFYSHSTKVLSSIQAEMYQKMEALHSFSTILTLRGIDLNTTWPFFTVDNSAHYFDTYLAMMNAACLLVMPVIPSSDIRSQWEEYAVENQGWIDKEMHTRDFFSTDRGMNHTSELWNDYSQLAKFGRIPKSIHNVSGIDTANGPYVVPWQFTPVIEMREIVNYNYLSDSEFAKEFVSLQQGMATMSSIRVFHNSSADGTTSGVAANTITNLSLVEKFEYQMLQKFIQSREVSLPYTADEPMSYIRYPVVDNFPDHVEQPRTVVILSAGLYWKTYFMNQLPDDVHGVYCVVQEINQIENETSSAATYVIDGSNATWIGSGDLHDQKYDHMKQEFNLSSFGGLSSASKEYIGAHIDSNRISYTITIYPSSQMEDDYNTSMPLIYASVMLLIFVFTALMFAWYNWYVEQRQKKIMATAMKTNAVVNSLFPSNVRDRILNNMDDSGNKRLDDNINDSNKKNASIAKSNMALRAQSEAIADFYPDVTLCFADLCGFTAYCSQRKPCEVFLLLETVFGSFDKIALRLGVFKVESVGDCYVAACGLPEKRKDHAVTMAKFARLCLDSLPSTLSNLERTLGPGTSDLRHMRFGIHTGSVTAGVVRGQNARFQLFGDAVNMASRMESTGKPGSIQISTITADHLVSDGKGHWLKTRDDRVNVKGKGELETYWLLPIRSSDNTLGTSDTRSIATESIVSSEIDSVDGSPTNSHIAEDNDIIQRLVNWNVDMLTRILRQIAYKRYLSNKSKHISHDNKTHDNMRNSIRLLESKIRNNEMSDNTDFSMAIDEVNESIDFTCDDKIYVSDDDRIKYEESTCFDEDVVKQLSNYLQVIARSYRPNYFHNFAHASHVTSSVAKLLSRIVPPSSLPSKIIQNQDEHENTMHDNIHKIVSDPLTQFACIFAAIIHDCDHYGVPNAQLVKERLPISQLYGNRSVAEQNSIDIAFKILMEDCYGKLRSAIYSTTFEFVRFRQLVVNGVIATDIMDKNLKELRNARWDRAFNKNLDKSNNIEPIISEMIEEKNHVNRKVTIIIEHLIQASDIAHTMQHWHVYRKWNECFFMECCQAYKNGQADSDPAINWYQGELGFFDFYIIPLTKKLKDCGVFGVSSDEYLDYALQNRQEWENKGQQIVAEMVQNWSLMETQGIQN